jgi:serine/threonine protein kinase
MTERFDLIEVVGRGAMGVVWRARDSSSGKTVALKLIRGAYVGDPEYTERFAREIELACRVKSPHIVRVRGYGQRQGAPFVVLEFVSGQSLRARLKESGPFPTGQARGLLAQIADALAAIHAAGIVHRDVKASNVLLTDAGIAKLTDFGIARTDTGPGRQRTTGLVGTPAYMAPEGPRDARSDLYSLGVLYYELLTGNLPFPGTSYQEVLLAHASQQPDLRRVPPTEKGLVGWLLSKDPAARPQSAAALLAALGWQAAGPAMPSGRPSSSPSPPVLPKPSVPVAPQEPVAYRAQPAPAGSPHAVSAAAANRLLPPTGPGTSQPGHPWNGSRVPSPRTPQPLVRAALLSGAIALGAFVLAVAERSPILIVEGALIAAVVGILAAFPGSR